MVFTVFDENASYYLDENIASFTPGADISDEDFQESNLMHSINGYLYSKIPGLSMRKGERVRWYTIALGTEVDLHTPHWHGHMLDWDRKRVICYRQPSGRWTCGRITQVPGCTIAM